MHIKFLIYVLVFEFGFMKRSEALISPLEAIFRDIESTFINTILHNCTKNMQLMLINPQTVNLIAPKLLPKINFIHYFSSTTKRYPLYDFYNRMIDLEAFDSNLPIVIITPGYWSSVTPRNYFNLAETLRDTKKFNVFILDQGLLADSEYMFTINSVPVVGQAVGEVLSKFYHKFPNMKFHLMGYSVGAYTSAYIGRSFERFTGRKIDRITAMEAARPCFDVSHPPLKLLNPDDATFVDVIHTSTGIFGYPYDLGHADFYPNGGISQTACGILPFCSHLLATTYFADSIAHDNYVAVECKSWDLFQDGACTNNTNVKMGYHLPSTTRGRFFLRTDGFSPFGLGMEGIVPSN